MRMDYEQSIEVVSSFLFDLAEKGLEAFITLEASKSEAARRENENNALLSALSTVKAEPSANRLLAETLLQSVFAALEPFIETFQDSLLSRSRKQKVRGDRLQDDFYSSTIEESEDEAKKSLLFLHLLYTLIRPHAERWCTQLGVPCMAALLPMHIRFKLLEHNALLFGEVKESHSQCKVELFYFLRQHWRQLLHRVEESSTDAFSVLNDEIIKCLHDLTLSSSGEIQQLLLEVLIQSLQEKMDELDEDYSVRVLEPYLAWEERVIEPFLYVCLPPPGSTSSSRFLNVSQPHSSSYQKEKHADSSNPLDQIFQNQLVQDGGKIFSQGEQIEGKMEDNGNVEFHGAQEGSLHTHYRMMINDWSATLQHRLRLLFGRKRLATFWDVLVDFPDSIPALEDLRACMQLNHDGTLRQEVIVTVRALLAQRLHRAGVRTEDIIEMVIKTVYALFIIFSYSEQSVVFSIIGDTLAHMGKRKDCAAAVVQSMQQLSELHHAKSIALAGSESPSTSGIINGNASGLSTGGEAPDFFFVLSTVIPVSELISGYRKTLSAQLLSKDLHDYDTSNEEEIIERLKCNLGERLLSDCIIMLRDIAFSRRVSQRLVDLISSSSSIDRRKDALFSSEHFTLPPLFNVRSLILSRVAWPEKFHRLRGAVSSGRVGGGEEGGEVPFSLSSNLFFLAGSSGRSSFSPKIHHSLEGLMNRLSDAFRVAMPNRRLCWHHSLGRVKLHWMQRHIEEKRMKSSSFVVSLFSASILLYIQELSGVPLSTTFREGEAETGNPKAMSGHDTLESSHDSEEVVDNGISVSKLAEALEVNEVTLERYLYENLAPRMVRMQYRRNPGRIHEKGELWVQIQTMYSSGTEASAMALGHATAVEEGGVNTTSVGDEEEASGLPPQQMMQLRKTVLALLRAARQKNLAEITNSLKQFSPIPFSASDLKILLKTLEKEGLVIAAEGGYRFKR